jgi:uncharacterized membrane protein YhaH (DUF805 family)
MDLNGLVESYVGVLKKYAEFEGRTQRREFWVFFLCNFIIGIVLGILQLIPIIKWVFLVVSSLYSLAILVPSLAIGARRLHDTNRSALLLLLGLIPLVGTIILIVFWAQEGTSGENQYGAEPKSASAA